MSTPTRILVIDGHHGLALHVARCLGRTGAAAVHVLSDSWHAPACFSRHVRGRHVRPMPDERAVVEQVRAVARRIGAQVLLPVGIDAVRLACVHRAELSEVAALPPLPDTAAFDTVNDKWLMARWMERYGLASPRTVLLGAVAESRPSWRSLRFPVLVKPARGDGGRQIRRFDDPATLSDFAAGAATVGTRWIAQEYLDGPDVDCNVLCVKGRVVAACTQRPLIAAAQRYAPASAIEFVDDPAPLELVCTVMAQLNWSGVAHVDLRLDPAGRVHLIEINPRYWATLMGSLEAGINFPWLACQAALGRPIEPQRPRLARFAGASVALGQWRQAITGHAHQPFKLHETALPHLMSDPIPELVRFCGSMARRMARRAAVSPVTGTSRAEPAAG